MDNEAFKNAEGRRTTQVNIDWSDQNEVNKIARANLDATADDLAEQVNFKD